MAASSLSHRRIGVLISGVLGRRPGQPHATLTWSPKCNFSQKAFDANVSFYDLSVPIPYCVPIDSLPAADKKLGTRCTDASSPWKRGFPSGDANGFRPGAGSQQLSILIENGKARFADSLIAPESTSRLPPASNAFSQAWAGMGSECKSSAHGVSWPTRERNESGRSHETGRRSDRRLP